MDETLKGVVQDVQKVAKKVAAKTSELLDKTRSPASRAGNTVERVGKLAKSNVSAHKMASKLTAKSRTGQTYDDRDVSAYNKLWADACAGSAGITKKDAEALGADQKVYEPTPPNPKPA